MTDVFDAEELERARVLFAREVTFMMGAVAISGLPPETEDAVVFHAGTRLDAGDDRVLSAGGRVLCVTALADSVKLAQQRAYEVVSGIRFAGAQYRRDIGHRAIAKR